MRPIFFEKSLIVGNRSSPVAICTLWSKKEVIAQNLPQDKYCVIGNLYSADGINYLIKNILANPQIRYLVVCGQDFFKSGEILTSFFSQGVGSDRKIIGAEAYLHSNIPFEAIEQVRKNVQLIDLRGKEGELARTIEAIDQKVPSFMEPILLPDESRREQGLSPKIIGFKIDGSLSEVWLKILDLAMKFGETKESEHELKQKEALDVLAVINEFSLKPFFGFEEAEVQKYINSFFSSEQPKELEYTYGTRLFRFAFEYVSEKFGVEMKFFVNQIDRVVEMIKKSPFSRRVVACLWNPFIDIDSKNPPCLTQINWNVKNQKLYQTCIIRSHDLFGAYLLNVLALRKLQEKICLETGLEPGDLIILSQSAHVYENSWSKVERLLEENYRNREVLFKNDEAGYFRIEIQGEELVAKHYLNDGRQTAFEFKGKSAGAIYKKIINENLVSRLDHAAYLGQELSRAEACLKGKKEYIQEGS